MAFLLTFCLQHLKPDVTVWVESENGILGMGPYPSKDEVDAYVLIDYVAPLTVLDDVLNVAVISSTPERRPSRLRREHLSLVRFTRLLTSEFALSLTESLAGLSWTTTAMVSTVLIHN